MSNWGKAMYVTPSVIVDGNVVTNDLVDINLGMRILLGSSFYNDWENTGEELSKSTRSGTLSTSGIRGIRPLHRDPKSATSRVSIRWVMSPRWFDKNTGDHLALDTGGGPIARLWATALNNLVDIGYIQGDRPERQDQSAEDRAVTGNGV